MIAQPYENLSGLTLLELAVYREARGEPEAGKRAVAHVIKNRVYSPIKWWKEGHESPWHGVILHPYQFSSFLPTDPNEKVWPKDDDPAFAECCQAATPVFLGHDEDITKGATYYHDMSIAFPHAWGKPEDYELTLEVGRLRFYRKLVPNNHEEVQTASAAD